MNDIFIHKLSDVQSDKIGRGTKIWQFCVILQEANIGENCNICSHVLIENKVKIGSNVTIKNCVQVWDGVELGDYVHIGPNVTFTNDLYPRSKNHDFKIEKTIVKNGASVGANSTIIAGNIVGDCAMIGAGTVVNRNIPPYTVWVGNPCKMIGYVSRKGKRYSINDSKTIHDFEKILDD